MKEVVSTTAADVLLERGMLTRALLFSSSTVLRKRHWRRLGARVASSSTMSRGAAEPGLTAADVGTTASVGWLNSRACCDARCNVLVVVAGCCARGQLQRVLCDGDADSDQPAASHVAYGRV